MSKDKSTKKPERMNADQRRVRAQQILFAAFAILIILSMVVSLIAVL